MFQYIIFLPNSLVLKNCILGYSNIFCCSKYVNLIEALTKNGIEIKKESDINDWLDENMNSEHNENLTFDYENRPELNKLYIYLCGTLYFSAENYTRYRLNLEKDLLLLICGNLGAKEISVEEQRLNREEHSAKLNLNVENVNTEIENTKMSEDSSKNELKETYSLDTKTLLFEKDRDTFETELFKKLQSISINYKEYYNICSKLKIFACKRFDLRMNTYSYHLEQESKNEKIRTAKLLLSNYGLGISDTNSTIVNFSYNYNIIFYDNDELFFYNKLIDNTKKDIFVKLRREYVINKKMNLRTDLNWGGDSTEILKEVEEYTKRKNTFNELEKWYNEDSKNRGELEEKCHYIKNEIDTIKYLKMLVSNIKL